MLIGIVFKLFVNQVYYLDKFIKKLYSESHGLNKGIITYFKIMC